MLITFLRSSSLSGFSWCQWKYFLQYNLGLTDQSGKAAQTGSIAHKALELLARRKLADQQGHSSFADEELKQEFKDVPPALALSVAWDHYTNPLRTKHTWGETDFQECHRHVETVLTYNSGEFNPANLEIVAPELYYDLEVKRPWSKWSYPQAGTGHLRIKGTMDLIFREAPGILHYVDYKTGRRYDYKKRQEKDIEGLKNDPQFLLYYYALTRSFPDEQILFTIFYTKSGGPFTIYFDDKDLVRAENILRENFEKIRDCSSPRRVKDGASDLWKCKYCHYEETGQCDTFHKEYLQIGYDKMVDKYLDTKAVFRYGSGGGNESRD